MPYEKRGHLLMLMVICLSTAFGYQDNSKVWVILICFWRNASKIAKPQFKPHVKTPQIIEQGFVLYYSNQCPFTVKYVPLIENVAKQKGIPFKSILFETTEQAQNAPAPFTTYSLFYNGEFLTNEILSEKKFEKILTEKGL